MKTKFYPTTDVQKTSKTTVQISRSFKAGRDLVFKAFTKPVLIKRSKGVTTVTTEIKYQSAKDMTTALSTGMADGMEMSYKSLDKILSKGL